MALKLKLTLRRKILLACYFLAFTLLAGAYFINRFSVSEAVDRGRFLEKHMQRFLNYEGRIGDNLTALVQSLVDADRALLVQAATDATPSGERAALIRAKLLRPLGRHLKPGLIAVVDRAGRLLAKGPHTSLTQDQVSGMRLFTDLLQGVVVGRLPVGDLFSESGAVLVHDNQVYQIAGVPVRDDDGKVVAAVAVGIDIERYFRDYMKQSDNRTAKQHRLTFVYDDRVVASVLPRDQWDDLAPRLRQAGARIRDGRPADTWHFKHAGKTWDYDMAAMTGYAGTLHGKIGRLYIMRTREHKKAELSALYQENRTFIIVGGLLTLLVGWFLSWLITRPLEQFIVATQDVAAGKGDLSKRIELRSRDEFVQLGENINRIFSNLQILAGDVQSAGLQVGASSAQIGAASRQMLEGAKDQAVRVESSSAAVTELSASIQQVAENAMEATRRAEQSGAAVSGAIERMNTIRSTVDETAIKIRALGESIKRIGNIVEVIRQISEQTSLLALNASIEAAHAGEQGRGFAVVADEVSSLARRVGQSAKDIEDLIATITDQTSDAVQSMGRGTQVVEEGTSLVSTTLDDLRKIIEVIQDTARSVQEQAVVSDDIARNMDAVREIAHKVVDASEDAVTQGEELFQLAGRLESSVAGFSMGDRPAAERALPAHVAEDGDPPARGAR
jgi:methyl-accepting chemotaxis protein